MESAVTDPIIPALAFIAAVFALAAALRFLLRTVLVMGILIDALTAEPAAPARPAPRASLPIAA